MRLRYIFIPLVLVVLIAAALIALLAANVDRYRPKIEAELQKKLDRQVTVDHLGLRVFPLSVRADNVTVSDDPKLGNARPFATAKEVYISVGLISLIQGNPEVKSLSLDHPQVELIRNAAGVWNFSTIGATNQKTGQQSDLMLNSLQISDGQVAITDQSTQEPRSVYDHIDLKLSDFAPHKQFGIDAAIHFPGQGKQQFSFKGKAGPMTPGNTAAMPLSGHISLEQVSLSAANRFAKGALPPNTDASATGGAEITSQGQVLSAKGNLKLENAVIKGAKLDYPISSQYDLSMDREQDKVNVRSGTLSLGSTALEASGEVDTKSRPANLNLRISTKDSSIAEIAKLAGALGIAFDPTYQVKGKISADITAKGPESAPQLNGSLEGRNLDISGGEIKEPVSIPDITLQLSPEIVRSNTFTARSGSTSLDLTFSLSQYASPNPNVDATIKTDGAQVTELLNVAKAYGIADAKGVSGTGTLSANVHVSGPIKDTARLTYAGTANIMNARVSTPEMAKPLSIASANAQFSQNSVAISNLAASLGETTVHGNISARNLAAPDVQFALSAEKIDTADLQSVSRGKNPASTPTPASHSPSLLDKMTGSGTLAVNTLKASDLVLTNVHANCKLDHGLITLSPVSVGVFGGSANGSLTLDARPATPTCAVNMKLTGVDTNALLSATTSVKNTLYGSLAANANLRFALESSAELPRTLNGTLGFNVSNGQLKNVNILNEISRIGKFLNAGLSHNTGNDTALQRLSGTMNIVNGEASTDNLMAALTEASLSAKGSLNLASQQINMHVSTVMASGPSQAVGGTRVGGFLDTALANNKGELVIPAIVTGTMSHPTFTPDVDAMAKMKLSHLLPTSGDPGKLTSGILGGKGVGGILNGVLGGGASQQTQPQPGTQKQQNQTPQNAVNSILNQFGKKKK